jgi:hypothetical protein
VIAPARTGNDRRRRIVVMPTAQINKDIWSRDILGARIFIIVEIKFTAPRIEEIPAKCKLKIARSTDLPLWEIFLAKGG